MTLARVTLPRWLRPGVVLPALLGVSLALNLALAAFPHAVFGRPPPRGGGGGGGFERMVDRMETALPEADRQGFRRVMAAEREHYTAPLEALRQARREVDAAILADPFDPERLRMAMADWQRRFIAFNDAFSDALVRGMAAVSPEGRAQVAATRGRGGG